MGLPEKSRFVYIYLWVIINRTSSLRTSFAASRNRCTVGAQHGLRHRIRQPGEIVHDPGLLIQESGHFRVFQPIDQAVQISSSFTSAQKNRSGFPHIAYLTVKKYLKALLAVCKDDSLI